MPLRGADIPPSRPLHPGKVGKLSWHKHLNNMVNFYNDKRTDLYRELLGRGGAPFTAFHAFIQNGFIGRGKGPDLRAMMKTHPFYDEYWQTHRIPVENMPDDLPCYGLASYSSSLHTFGSIRTWRESPCKNKWLRWHPYQEWWLFHYYCFINTY